MVTAVITGASSGLGTQFAKLLKTSFPEVECLWLIARSAGKLEELSAELGGIKVKILQLDLCDAASFEELATELEREGCNLRLLVNNAGCGYLGNVKDSILDKQTRMADLNVRAMTAVAAVSLPHMSRGAHIINVSSIASFCPNPRMAVYSSTKAYISSFSRALHEELKGYGISVTAVCPGPMNTNFLDIGDIRGNSLMFKLLPYCDPARVAKGAYNAAKAGRVFYTPRYFYKFYRVLGKIVPHALLAKIAKT